ncbi:MAG: hypothetical protein FJ144_25060 [Deltaproteobacteria bacterium]|nr:hypothetical protein [Deltaproteobacteria bacterium]
MSNQEKDRLGDKLRDLEHGREDHFFAERDKALLAKLRAKGDEPIAATGACPLCGQALQTLANASACAAGHGVWLTRSQLEEMAGRSDGLRELLARLA